jgi:hypothetical protein
MEVFRKADNSGKLRQHHIEYEPKYKTYNKMDI